jgi:hypothetical protein
MRTLQEALRTTTASLNNWFHVSMTYFAASDDSSAYWTVTVLGRGEFSRTNAVLCGKNPLAVLRAILQAESQVQSYSTVPGVSSRSAAVREVEALVASHGASAISLDYYSPTRHHEGFFGAAVQPTRYSCVMSEGGFDTLQGAVMDAFEQVRKAA